MYIMLQQNRKLAVHGLNCMIISRKVFIIVYTMIIKISLSYAKLSILVFIESRIDFTNWIFVKILKILKILKYLTKYDKEQYESENEKNENFNY